jgi:site-specific recombinase XerD
MKIQPNFSALLQSFFTGRLLEQRNASPHTIASYRDTFRLLLKFAHKELHKSPSMLAVENLNAPFIGRFLNHLENDRGNTPRSRNIRLAAIHSFFASSRMFWGFFIERDKGPIHRGGKRCPF